MLQAIFIVLSLITLGAAIMVVSSRNLFRSALWLILTFFGIAAIFVLLNVVAGFSLLLFVILLALLTRVRWPVTAEPVPPDAIARLGAAFVGPYVVPFEVASVLLVVAMIGAIIIARERE
jgi:NADH:ubiquinone oxidoreductase subunit 6 (subunit J)